MYSNRILNRFKSPEYAGGLRGANGTGRAGNETSDLIKIYILVNDEGVIERVNFKAYGGVCTIVAGDCACELIDGASLEEALRVNNYSILQEMGEIPEEREYVGNLAEEAIKSAIEDYYKKREKELKKQGK